MSVGPAGPLGNKLLQDFRRKNKTEDVNSFSLLRMFNAYLGSNPKELVEDRSSLGRNFTPVPEYDK